MNRLFTKLVTTAVLLNLTSYAAADVYFSTALGATHYDLTDESSTGIEIGGGIYLSPLLAAELTYLDLGELPSFGYDQAIKISGFNFAAKAILPLADGLRLYGKAGWYMWEASEQYRYTSLVYDEGVDIMFAAGLAWRVTSELDLNLEIKELQLNEAEANNVSVGITFSF